MLIVGVMFWNLGGLLWVIVVEIENVCFKGLSLLKGGMFSV